MDNICTEISTDDSSSQKSTTKGRKRWGTIIGLVIVALLAFTTAMAFTYPHYSGVARVYENIRGEHAKAQAVEYIYDKYGDTASITSMQPVRYPSEGGLGALVSAPNMAHATRYDMQVGDERFAVLAYFSNKGLRDDPIGKLEPTGFADNRQFNMMTNALARAVAEELGLGAPIAQTRYGKEFITELLSEDDLEAIADSTSELYLVFPAETDLAALRKADVFELLTEGTLARKPFLPELSLFAVEGDTNLFGNAERGDDAGEAADNDEIKTADPFGLSAYPDFKKVFCQYAEQVVSAARFSWNNAKVVKNHGQAPHIQMLDEVYLERLDGELEDVRATPESDGEKEATDEHDNAEANSLQGDVRVENAKLIPDALPEGYEFLTDVCGCPGLLELPLSDEGLPTKPPGWELGITANHEYSTDGGAFLANESTSGVLQIKFDGKPMLVVADEVWRMWIEKYDSLVTVSCEGNSSNGLRAFSGVNSAGSYVYLPIDVPIYGAFAIAGHPKGKP